MRIICLFLFFLIGLSAYTDDRKVLQLTAFTSPVLIIYYGNELDPKSLEEIKNWLSNLDSELSRQNPLSLINKVNKSAALAPQKMSIDMENVFKRAQRLTELSGGLFDASLGPIISLWDIGGEKQRIPSKAEIKAKQPLVNFKNVIYSAKDHTIFYKKIGMELDFGGVAKGYAADWVSDYMKKKGYSRVLVNMGQSSIRMLGEKPDGVLWTVGLQDPIAVLENKSDGEGSLLGKLELKNLIMSTSGIYERYFKEKGRIYHHIIDPQTLEPAQTGIYQVSIISDELTDLPDGFSTACLIGGVNKAFSLASKLPGLGLIIVTEDKKIYLNAFAKSKFTALENAKSYTIIVRN